MSCDRVCNYQYSLCIGESFLNGFLNLLTEIGWKWYSNEHSTSNTKWQISICIKTHCSNIDNENKALVDLPMILATSSAQVTLYGAWNPLLAEKKAGKSEPKEATVTPSVSRYSSVRPISRMDLTPAHTTATGVLPSSVKSALTSRAVCTNQHV